MKSMSKSGYIQGDMNPSVDDIQLPNENYSQEFMNKTTEYIERQNREQKTNSKEISKQSYKGRYS